MRKRMGDTGFFLPLLIVVCVGIALLIGLLDEWTQPKTSYKKWLEKELKRNPDYINWLKGSKDYKSGLRITKRIESEENKSYKRWLKRIRKIGKY